MDTKRFLQFRLITANLLTPIFYTLYSKIVKQQKKLIALIFLATFLLLCKVTLILKPQSPTTQNLKVKRITLYSFEGRCRLSSS